MEHTEEIPCEPEDRDLVPEDEVRRLNEMAEIEKSQEPQGHQNVTVAEVIPDRTVESLVRALSRLHAKYRMLGIQVYRLHTDRERSFASAPIQKWCEQRQIRLTMTAGDDSKANGRVEGEVNQLKRRTRLFLHDAGLPHSFWPVALRHASEQRVRLQLERLGLESPPMLRFGASVLVKSKRWHRAGQLSMPYRTMQLLGPCPYMSHGWIVRDKKGQLLHVRTALEPSPVADQAIMELQEVPAVKHRITGKHPPPLPDHPLAGRVGALYEESVPALATCRAGGEDSLDSLDWSSSLDVGKSLSLGLEPKGELEEVNGGHELHDKVEPGDELLHHDLRGEVEDPLLCDWQQVEKWHELEQQRHWALKQLWCQGLREVAVGENSGSVHGSWLHEVELLLKGAEDQLSFQHSAIENFKLSALAPSMGTPDAPATVLQTYTVSLQQVRRELEKWKPPLRDEYGQLVSSTQAIKPTTEEKLRLDPRFPTMELAPAMLVPTVKSPHGRLRARVVICGNHLTKVNEESNNSAGETQPKDSNPFSLYAGGADGTTLRCLMKCAAENSWSVGTVDIKTAFLLAPRPDEQERLLVARPPKVLVEAGICDAAELWEISHAVYGLNDAPANWSQYRDRELPQLRFSAGGHDYQLVSTPEPNLWKLIKTDPGALPQEDNSEGFLAVYVDDMLVAAPGPLAKSVIDGIRAHWRCSEPEWATAEKAIKFCGFEISCSDEAVILNQASYTRDLLSRHEGIKSRQTPLPLGVQDEVEADVQISQVRRAQALVGELLWLSGRTRPDLCYGVSIMGRLVTKAPTKVLEWGAHMLGYLQHTVDYELRYTKQVVESSLDDCDAAKKPCLKVYSDASHGPQGGRGQQGLLVTYNGSPVQWESKQQPFATLSSAEAELMGYVDGVVIGESVASVVNVLEDNRLHLQGQQVLCGDSQTGLKILVAPDGPWRTRHLRLRAFVVKERIQQSCWKTQHVPGAELASDLLTKPIVNPTLWQNFYTFIGARVLSKDVDRAPGASLSKSRLMAILGGIIGMAAWNPSQESHKVARCVTISALVAALAIWWKKDTKDPTKTNGHLTVDSRAGAPMGSESVETRKSRSVRENEPTAREGLGGLGPSLNGYTSAASRACDHGVRLAALGARAGPEQPEERVWEWFPFQLPPQGRDRWGRLRYGWWVRHHVKPRKRPFHPLHRMTPFNSASIRHQRVTVVWHHGEKTVFYDDWRSGIGPVLPDQDQWVGYTFFREIPSPDNSLGQTTTSTDPPTSSSGPPPVDDTLEPPQRRATLDSVAENSTGTPSSEQVEFPTANVTWVRTEVHSVRRTSSSSSSAPSQTSPSTRSSATGSTAAARGSDAIDAGVTLGYMGRLGGYLSRGENLRSGPASSATESESEREDWRRNLDVSSTSSVQGHETTLPPGLPPLHEHLDEVPQWMGIVSQLPVRPRGVPGQSDHLRDPDSDSDGSYEVCG